MIFFSVQSGWRGNEQETDTIEFHLQILPQTPYGEGTQKIKTA